MSDLELKEIELEEEVRTYEARLRESMGLGQRAERHFRRPEERQFTAAERPHTTVLISGLTLAHEELIKGAWEGQGYRIDNLPVPDNAALAAGKEFGNRGQCNPTYYTVGNLVKHLVHLRRSGMPVEEIDRNYVFLTAGACGPCRFGMYEAEYRKALTDAGFPNFRVLLFQQGEGLSQAQGEEAGVTMNAGFFVAMLKAMMAGDLLNDLGYKIRPYEVNRGETDRVLEEAKAYLRATFRSRAALWRALRHVREMFAAIPVDYTRVKPKVKITGEFFAMTTEGDGNYHMARWLEAEGAEVIVEPIGTWIEYLIWTRQEKARDRMGIAVDDPREAQSRSVIWKLKLAKLVFRAFYDTYRACLGFKSDPLPDQDVLARYGHQYYNTRLGGGEGHLEVAKNIMAVVQKKAHMVISLKPFGCMPSTQSDGVQTKVVSDYKDAIFIPIETSGDGEVNVKSRVQMKLYEAKKRAREEFQRALEAHGLTVEEVREYLAAHPRQASAIRPIPHHAVGTAASIVIDAGRRAVGPASGARGEERR